jgi:hypothetical protein
MPARVIQMLENEWTRIPEDAQKTCWGGRRRSCFGSRHDETFQGRVQLRRRHPEKVISFFDEYMKYSTADGSTTTTNALCRQKEAEVLRHAGNTIVHFRASR